MTADGRPLTAGKMIGGRQSTVGGCYWGNDDLQI
jgi:hypothetical protein